jgi:hypothetical protein
VCVRERERGREKEREKWEEKDNMERKTGLWRNDKGMEKVRETKEE